MSARKDTATGQQKATATARREAVTEKHQAIKVPGGAVDVEALRREVERLQLVAAHNSGLLDAVLSQTPHGIIICDENGKLILQNQAAERIWAGSATADTVEGWGKYRAFHPDGRPFAPGEWQMARCLTERTVNAAEEFHIQRFDDSFGFVLGSSAPIYGDDKKFIGAVSVFADITHLKQMEAALRETSARERVAAKQADEEKARLSAMLRQMPSGVVIADVPSGRVTVNAQVERIFGRAITPAASGDEYGGFDHVFAEDKYKDPKNWPMVRAMGGEVISNEEMIILRSDGSRGIVNVTGGPVRNAANEIIAAITTVDDITERKRLEERERFLADAVTLLSSSLDYETTLASVAWLSVPRMADWCSVDMREEDGRIRSLAVAHRDPDKVIWARKLGEKYPIDPNDPHGVPNVLRTGKPEWAPFVSDELLVQGARDPEHLRIMRELGCRSFIVVPLTARGATLGAVTFVTTSESGRRYDERDVAHATELAARAGIAIDNARLFKEANRAEQELLQLNQQLEERVKARTAELEEANRELESFSYSVSHDLRAPVRHISGFAKLLSQHAGDKLDERSRHYIQTIVDAAAQSGRLVDDLLAFSRMGRTELKVSMVDMAQLVARARAEVQNDAGDRHIDWTIGALPTIFGEPAMLALVWNNLLGNAVKFTRGTPHARIEIGSERGADEVVFYVRDNGAGFEMQYVAKLFGVFQRLHKTEEFEGTGIGLANVRRIVGRLGGRTWAQGAPGEGATFYFSLPDKGA